MGASVEAERCSEAGSAPAGGAPAAQAHAWRTRADDAHVEDVQRRRQSPRVEGLQAGGCLKRVTRKRKREDAPQARRGVESDDDREVTAMETDGEEPPVAMEGDVAEAAA